MSRSAHNPLIGEHVVNAMTLRRMLAEARAQYDLRPSDYLEGVVTALLETLDDTPFITGHRPDDQETNAAGRTAHARVRDYLNGKTATFSWILGEAPPPIQSVLTEPP